MITLEHVSRYFGDFKAVDDISFTVNRGEIVGLLGPNGAGKTTTMRMITGYLGASEGRITIGDELMTVDSCELKRKIGYMSESIPLYTDMIVEDYLRYVSEIHGASFVDKIRKTAQLCGITDVMHKNIGDLSRGYRQRVGLAHALLHDPEILVLDEPTSGLDPNQIIEVRNLIREIGKTRTVIISTHILSEVEMLCARVIIISQGKIVADSPTSLLHQRVAQQQEVTLAISASEKTQGALSLSAVIEALSSIEGATVSAQESNTSAQEGHSTEGDGGSPLVRVTVSIAGDRERRPEIFERIVSNGWVLFEMSLKKTSLEDVFRNLTAPGEHS